MKKRDTVPATVRMKIALWASANAEKLKGTNCEECKGLIKKEFGVVAATNFVRDLYHAVGIRIPRERPSIPASATDTSTNRDKLGLRLRVLARIVRTGFKDAGLPVPPALDAICTGNTNPELEAQATAVSLEKNTNG